MDSQNHASVVNDLTARARAALAEHPLLVVRHIVIEHTDDALLISGEVRSFYQKQIVQEVLRRVAGPVRLENRLFVHYDDVRPVEEL